MSFLENETARRSCILSAETRSAHGDSGGGPQALLPPGTRGSIQECVPGRSAKAPVIVIKVIHIANKYFMLLEG